MSESVSRRGFVQGAVAAAGAVPLRAANALPTREFGKTGARPSILAIGCGNRLYAGYAEEKRGVEALNLAIESGITYFDTAQSYGNGISESWVGIATEGRRKGFFIATKTTHRKYDDLMREFDQSLRRLRTDHVDLLHIHSLRFEDDLKAIEAKGGALEALHKLRDQKAARFIGITSHIDPATLALALERHDFDATQMALNAGLQGRSPDGAGFWKKTPKGQTPTPFDEPLPPKPHPGSSFQDIALPVAVRKKLGIIAMKVTGQDGLVGMGSGKAQAQDLIRYALSLPVSVVTVGMPKLEFIGKNTTFARSFQPMPRREMEALSERLAAANKVALDRHFATHEDA